MYFYHPSRNAYMSPGSDQIYELGVYSNYSGIKIILKNANKNVHVKSSLQLNYPRQDDP